MAIWWYLIPIAKFFSRELIGRICRPPGNPAPAPPLYLVFGRKVIFDNFRKSLTFSVNVVVLRFAQW